MTGLIFFACAMAGLMVVLAARGLVALLMHLGVFAEEGETQ